MDIKKEKITRRRFLDFAITFFIGLGAIGTVYPVLRFLFPPKENVGGREEKILAGELSEIPEGKSKFFRFRNKPSIIINTKVGITAVSAVCTHLGCIVKWDETTHLLKCPCHEGIFDPTGKVLSGPPPKPLAPLQVQIVEDKIYVGE
jgi:cytochrome b6-f complex iron-sulfur subunit